MGIIVNTKQTGPDCEIDHNDTTAGQSPTGIEPRAGAISTELQELMKS